jgi:hypothetical protein
MMATGYWVAVDKGDAVDLGLLGKSLFLAAILVSSELWESAEQKRDADWQSSWRWERYVNWKAPEQNLCLWKRRREFAPSALLWLIGWHLAGYHGVVPKLHHQIRAPHSRSTNEDQHPQVRLAGRYELYLTLRHST